MAEKKEFTLEQILEEQRLQREGGQAPSREAPAREVPEPERASRSSAPDRAERKKKEKKEKKGLFGRKKKSSDFDEGEDAYYGIQLKPIDEYRKGYDSATGEFALGSYDDLFDDSKKAIDDEVEENFQRLQRERRRRVAEAVQTAGVDEEAIADEFGVVAPMPVTAFAADPYARQHGIEAEGIAGDDQEDISQIQKAMLENSQTMEVKLNVLNDTMEIQRIKDMPVVSDESISKILESADQAEKLPDQEYEAPPAPAPVEFAEPSPETPEASEEAAAEVPAEDVPAGEAEPEAASEEPEEESAEDTGRPVSEIPTISSIYEYRSRSIPTHVVNADLLQSALLSESEELMQAALAEEQRKNPNRRVRNRTPEVPEIPFDPDQSAESIDDFTGPEDIQSISHELRGDMRELTMRTTITAVCTVLLAATNLFCGMRFNGTGSVGSLPMVYIIMTVVFLGVSIGVCFRTVTNGLKALFSFNANSDSAAAVAAVAVIVQTLSAIFFRTELAEGKLHLYAVVLSIILFLNAAGKLTMIRRIHSNFRFVSSKEQKYAVRTYEDYNTALKMAKGTVADKPLIAYQCRAGFLKRFLELSYDPDPSEAASQLLAPIGLISSLVLCIVCLLITRSVPTALSALAASSCVCVAMSNMLSVNLPVSRLCKAARRAGAMVVGYDAVEQLGSVNALLIEAEDIFPRGTVVLNGIKTFGNRAGAEEAIIAASAVMNELGGPLSGVFDQVISENEDALPEVEDCYYEEGGGIVGQVDGRPIYIGSRTLLANHGVETPAPEEEAQYASRDQAVVYLAIDTAVAAMLVLSYTADRRRKNELQRLENSGISILVHTNDPNVTVPLVSRLFGIDQASVGVLDGELGEIAGRLTGMNIPRADAVVASKGRIESMMNVVADCVNEKRTVSLVVAIQNAAVILGFVLVAFMACFGGMRQLTSFILFVFELFWFLVILVIPKLRK